MTPLLAQTIATVMVIITLMMLLLMGYLLWLQTGLWQSKRGYGHPLDPVESGAFVTVAGCQHAKRGVSHADNQQRVESHT